MSALSVENAAQERRQAERKLRAECAKALAAGVPISRIARAAGVTRSTIYSWLDAAS